MQSIDTLLLNYYPILIFLLIAGVVATVMVGGPDWRRRSAPIRKSCPPMNAGSRRSTTRVAGSTCASISSPSYSSSSTSKWRSCSPGR